MSHKIEAVYEHDDGYRFVVVYKDKASFKHAIKRTKNCTWLNAVDYTEGVAIYPSNVWSYMRS